MTNFKLFKKRKNYFRFFLSDNEKIPMKSHGCEAKLSTPDFRNPCSKIGFNAEANRLRILSVISGQTASSPYIV